ncbi:ABC transporter ATP-binding protein [Dactylosporangium matsuzakiense]|uniref:ABC transporter ATP-binding protein n=1 Tax=Dactylosporangium matsuzakiense TaxID=53360 RepID=A0A9W6KSI6_9ACTN|nr:ABC transporter ATP-binding protein [Dactylosporangium matsuzakiense]UWZ49574.1 ABC transporter ATP-binding protein [Dactylosporangium matsuzakiense]GLL05615.1 ABC transporter ATP-binding protein [Dactylosporangium matsuzakiense]
MQNFAIEAEQLRIRYPHSPHDVVTGIDLAVAPGEVFGLLGPNGAGKSTTQRVLTGRHREFGGRAAVLGRPVGDYGRDLYERIGVGFELPAYFPRLTARENLAAFARLFRRPTMTPAEALAAVGLEHAADQRASTFSKGMKMRLNLARAILHRPDVLFLDEPTSGLDPVSAAGVRAVIRAQADAGRTVLLTTHDMPAVEELCTRVAFMRAGSIVAVDTPRNLRLAHGRRSVVASFTERGALRTSQFPAPDDPGLLRLLATGSVQTLHTREAALADVFIAVTQDAA